MIGDMVKMLNSVLRVVPVEKVAVHCHDTYGQSLANITVALQVRTDRFHRCEFNVRSIDQRKVYAVWIAHWLVLVTKSKLHDDRTH